MHTPLTATCKGFFLVGAVKSASRIEAVVCQYAAWNSEFQEKPADLASVAAQATLMSVATGSCQPYRFGCMSNETPFLLHMASASVELGKKRCMLQDQDASDGMHLKNDNDDLGIRLK